MLGNRQFKQKEQEATETIRKSLSSMSNLDTEALMSDIVELVSVTHTVTYNDDHLVHVKVDRRKNINKIKDDMSDTIRVMITNKYPGVDMDMILRIRHGNNIIIIKRRR